MKGRAGVGGGGCGGAGSEDAFPWRRCLPRPRGQSMPQLDPSTIGASSSTSSLLAQFIPPSSQWLYLPAQLPKIGENLTTKSNNMSLRFISLLYQRQLRGICLDTPSCRSGMSQPVLYDVHVQEDMLLSTSCVSIPKDT